MEARYRYRLRVSPTQARLLQGVFDSTRFMWNHTLGRWSDFWRYERERLSYGDASAELTHLRHTFEWLADQPHVPQQHNTSQTCSGCGAKAKRRLGLADRIFACSECGLVLDRDRNAARNLDPGVAGTEATPTKGQGVDGAKTRAPAGFLAA